MKSYQPKFASPTAFGGRKEDADIVKKIDVSLATLKADGTVKAIFEKYGVADALVP